MKNREIAIKIYEKLLEKGAGIGNASIPFIEKVLDESIPLDKPVKPANGGKNKEIITYVLTEPFHDDWYDVAEFDTLEEAKEEYRKKNVAAIMEKRLQASIIFKKG